MEKKASSALNMQSGSEERSQAKKLHLCRKPLGITVGRD